MIRECKRKRHPLASIGLEENNSHIVQASLKKRRLGERNIGKINSRKRKCIEIEDANEKETGIDLAVHKSGGQRDLNQQLDTSSYKIHSTEKLNTGHTKRQRTSATGTSIFKCSTSPAYSMVRLQSKITCVYVHLY